MYASILFSMLVGCSSGELGHTMGSWQGSQLDEVTLAWGSPDRCEEIDGRRVCSWYDDSTGFSATSTRACERTLEIDADGYITGWRWRGDDCFMTAEAVLARKMP